MNSPEVHILLVWYLFLDALSLDGNPSAHAPCKNVDFEKGVLNMIEQNDCQEDYMWL